MAALTMTHVQRYEMNLTSAHHHQGEVACRRAVGVAWLPLTRQKATSTPLEVSVSLSSHALPHFLAWLSISSCSTYMSRALTVSHLQVFRKTQRLVFHKL